MRGKHIAAFFDFDGTLIRSDSQSMELEHVLAHESPSPFFYVRLAIPAFAGFFSRLGLVSQEQFNRSYIKTYRGFSLPHLEERGQRLFEEKIRQDLMAGALDLLSSHRDKGHRIILVSASPHHLLEPVVKWLKCDHLVCTRLDVDKEGRCSGRPLSSVCIGQAKADEVRRLAGELNLDLAASYAYSDHHADLPFLESVGNPGAINPTPRLLRMARRSDWPVYFF